MKSWPEKKLYFHSLTFHYQGVGTVHKPLPEISSWQRSAWDCGFLSVAFWQNPGVQLCVALHCCLVFGRCCIRNIRSQHRRSFETGSGEGADRCGSRVWRRCAVVATTRCLYIAQLCLCRALLLPSCPLFSAEDSHAHVQRMLVLLQLIPVTERCRYAHSRSFSAEIQYDR